MIKISVGSLLVLMLLGCSSGEKKGDIEAPTPATAPSTAKESRPSSKVESVEENVDLRQLQTALKLDHRVTDIGYFEKQFNTCQVGAGYSSESRCRSLFLVVIHFKLSCRDSHGTVSETVTEANLQPIANQLTKWSLKNATGVIVTDSNGYGQIVMVSKESQRKQFLRLTVANDFLAIRAGEVRPLVAPKNWCQ